MEDTQVLQYRMYFFVPYNISPIQQAIQAGHAALEYARLHGDTEIFKEFVTHHKTWIILNGGTTNGKLREGLISSRVEPDPYIGSLDNLYVKMIDWNMRNKDNKILKAVFMEPDLNDALTALCFIADERVWDQKKYPDFMDFIVNIKMYEEAKEAMPPENYFALKVKDIDELNKMFPEYYEEWVAFLGGPQNVFLRELIANKRLA